MLLRIINYRFNYNKEMTTNYDKEMATLRQLEPAFQQTSV